VPDILIIAGPNGAGKTTFASEHLSDAQQRLQFVNADEIANEIGSSPGTPQRQLDVRAARIMLERIDNFAEAGVDFTFETTLATRTYVRKIPLWRRHGYTVSLIYLRLPSVEASIARVRRRVEAGGHDIPEATIRRRFSKSISYLEKDYKPLVDEWYIWDSLEGAFLLRESWDRT
jgi:predicted ABC-type ATPase